jgi:hypothetical protein
MAIFKKSDKTVERTSLTKAASKSTTKKKTATAVKKPEAPKNPAVSDSIKVGTHVTWAGEKDPEKVGTVTRIFEESGVNKAEVDCPWKTNNTRATTSQLSVLRSVECPSCNGSGRKY